MSQGMFIIVLVGGAALLFLKVLQLFRLREINATQCWYIVLGLPIIGVVGATADKLLELPRPVEGLLVLAVAVLIGLAIRRKRSASSDHPDLNRRHGGDGGRSFVLNEPISDGKGKLMIDDTVWEVLGPDAPVGARVKVTGMDGSRLRVAAA